MDALILLRESIQSDLMLNFNHTVMKTTIKNLILFALIAITDASWKIKTASVESALYTYNTGTLLQGAVLLFQFTGKKTYLESAKFLAEGSYKVFFKYADNGIPYIADLP